MSFTGSIDRSLAMCKSPRQGEKLGRMPTDIERQYAPTDRGEFSQKARKAPTNHRYGTGHIPDRIDREHS
jgi:hypothetical protein